MHTSEIKQAIPRFEGVRWLVAISGNLLARDSRASTSMYMLMQSRAMHRTFVDAFVEKVFVDYRCKGLG
jgi:hypothetical protein